MKIFIYKTLIVIFCVYVLFELTIGQKINRIEKKLEHFTSIQGRDQIMTKLKEEIKEANKKDNYFTLEERELFSNFIKKIRKELDLNNSQ